MHIRNLTRHPLVRQLIGGVVGTVIATSLYGAYTGVSALTGDLTAPAIPAEQPAPVFVQTAPTDTDVADLPPAPLHDPSVTVAAAAPTVEQAAAVVHSAATKLPQSGPVPLLAVGLSGAVSGLLWARRRATLAS